MGRLFAWLVLISLITTVVSDQGWFATSGESPQARAYMVALLQRETENVAALRPQQDLVSQAMAQQAARQSTTQAKPLSLTYLGGASQGVFSIQIYAVEVRANDGTQQLFPLALTLLGGKVVGTR
ncbi:MAG: hypothetical protein AUH85_09295 [Chloroflexi bacterium 13_1_40CM_4_68_4]|nr:MAG: hypothetical protein AUH85_09295 [Chloroflexi bacterium 13_1_40CM_4_68_4]